ncbi:MAG: methylenetetrahydrofolate reductase [NAD(P)H] [Sphingobacteriia bacterium]|jgi:methylenetetrahydrofolate reductase (NADPH)|nr:methylenetetrahydrofolate reductase [NAD(P)H] [Paludibacteraceae bacterium]NCA79543.1 methylenetetrahydrofolate reductase [NAD(P)H] [Sphingobacteriia bacterium]
MKIADILNKKKTLSFEVFPPKRNTDIGNLYEVIKDLDSLNPDFMSVTYGALGTTTDNSAMIAKFIKNNTTCEPLAHITGIASTKSDITNLCNELKAAHIENVLTLRGDNPDNQTNIVSDFKHASDLALFIRQQFGNDFSCAGACYPEKHPEAVSFETDIDNLKKKQEAGMQFFTTQLFFDNNVFYRFLIKARKAGITVPIIPGIMPVTNYKQIDRIIQVSSAHIPIQLQNYFDKYRNDKQALEEIGIIFTSYQILDLLTNDIDGLHIYSMNKSHFIKKLMDNISYVTTGYFANK